MKSTSLSMAFALVLLLIGSSVVSAQAPAGPGGMGQGGMMQMMGMMQQMGGMMKQMSAMMERMAEMQKRMSEMMGTT
jgi:hypothetical protein